MNPRDPMLVILAVGFIIIGVSVWHVQRRADLSFDLLDLLVENGRVSKIAIAFMLVLIVSTWVIVDQQISGNLTEGIFGMWLAAWVTPLVAKVVFQKTEMPTNTTITSLTETITTTEPAKNDAQPT